MQQLIDGYIALSTHCRFLLIMHLLEVCIHVIANAHIYIHYVNGVRKQLRCAYTLMYGKTLYWRHFNIW